MKVYLDGDMARRSERYTLHASPAGDAEFTGTEIPEDWFGPDGEPRNIEVVFRYGEAVVPDDLGRYLTKRGIARRTKILLASPIEFTHPIGVMA